MTKQEKLIVSAYTEYLMVDFNELQDYLSELLGRPIFTHELADDKVLQEIHAKVTPLFLELCKKGEQDD